MSPRKHGRHRSDDCQTAIVESIRLAGGRVEVIDRPVDLVASYAGATGLIECVGAAKLKANPPAGLTDGQVDFLSEWRGSWCVAYTPLDAITFLHTCAKGGVVRQIGREVQGSRNSA